MSKLFSNSLTFCNQFKYSIWLCAVWGFLFSQTIIGEAKIITVDSSIGQSVAPGGQTVFNSIQKAIDTASNGDTIKIKPGIYKESITFRKNLTLAGSGSEKTRLEFDREGLVLSASDVKRANIQGLTIAYTGQGQRSTLWFFRSNIILEDCTVKGGFYSGIYITAGSNVTIRRCQIMDNRRIGINIANSTVRLLKSKISRNGHYGLKITKCRDTVVEQCEIHQNKWSGIYISDGKSEENEPISIVTLRRNTIQSNQQDGIVVHMTRQTIVHQNWLQDNIGNGVKIEETAGQLIGNLISDNKKNGIIVRNSPSILIHHNTIASQKVGLDLQNAKKLDVKNNIIAYHQTGVITKSVVTATFDRNNLWANRKHYSNLKPPSEDIQYNPKFVSVEKKDYRLYDDSPMISNATDKTDIGGFTHSNPTDIIEKSQANNTRSEFQTTERFLPQPLPIQSEMLEQPKTPENNAQPPELLLASPTTPDFVVHITHLQKQPYLIEVGQTVKISAQTVFPKNDLKMVNCQLLSDRSEKISGFVYQKQELNWKASSDQIGSQTIRFQANQLVVDVRFFVWQQKKPPRITKINGNWINRTDSQKPVEYEVPANKESKLVFEAEGGDSLKFSYVFLPVGAKTKENILTWKPPRSLATKSRARTSTTKKNETSLLEKQSAKFPLLVVAENGNEVDVLDLVLIVELD